MTIGDGYGNKNSNCNGNNDGDSIDNATEADAVYY
jgi:hypothetical protein